MQYLFAAGIIAVALLLWVAVDFIARKSGYKSINEREKCGTCSCDNSGSCNNKSD